MLTEDTRTPQREHSHTNEVRSLNFSNAGNASRIARPERSRDGQDWKNPLVKVDVSSADKSANVMLLATFIFQRTETKQNKCISIIWKVDVNNYTGKIKKRTFSGPNR